MFEIRMTTSLLRPVAEIWEVEGGEFSTYQEAVDYCQESGLAQGYIDGEPIYY